MKKKEAVYIAEKFYEHSDKRHNADNKKTAAFHEGCQMMCLQIFEMTADSHKFGSPAHALGKI